MRGAAGPRDGGVRPRRSGAGPRGSGAAGRRPAAAVRSRGSRRRCGTATGGRSGPARGTGKPTDNSARPSLRASSSRSPSNRAGRLGGPTNGSVRFSRAAPPGCPAPWKSSSPSTVGEALGRTVSLPTPVSRGDDRKDLRRLVARASRPGDRPNLDGRRSFPGRKVQERADGRPEFPLAEPTGSAPGGPAFRSGKVRRRAAVRPRYRTAKAWEVRREGPTPYRVVRGIAGLHRTAAKAGSLGIACAESWSLNIDPRLAGRGGGDVHRRSSISI